MVVTLPLSRTDGYDADDVNDTEDDDDDHLYGGAGADKFVLGDYGWGFGHDSVMDGSQSRDHRLHGSLELELVLIRRGSRSSTTTAIDHKLRL